MHLASPVASMALGLLMLLLATVDPRSMSIDVVARAPGDHAGEDRARATANAHSTTLREGETVVTEGMLRNVPGLNLTHVQNNPLQADITFRGFTLSPLLGSAQGLSIYLDGIRLNEPFGDTVAWGTVPPAAIERVDLIPGSNPLFGLNTLGGAIVMRTRSGSDEGRVEVAAGSFGGASAGATFGITAPGWSSFLAADHVHEEGWRDHSPSRATRGFASATWIGSRTTAGIRAAGSTSDLTGNGPAPVQLLALDRSAVFTHPDTTRSTSLLLSSRAMFMTSTRSSVQWNGHLRRIFTTTLNGDDSPFDACDGFLCTEDGHPVLNLAGNRVSERDAVNNRGRSRQQTAGVGVQRDWTAGRHQLLAGAVVEASRSRFGLAVELADLGPDRSTIATGIEVQNGRVDLRSDLRTAGLFLSDRVEVTPALDLTFGLRYNLVQLALDDQIGSDLDGRHRFGHLNASLGAIRAFRGGVAVFGSMSRATRVPTPVELTCADPEAPCRLPNAFVSDPPLEPVRTTSFELGVRRSGSTSWAAALFHATNSDDIVFVSSGRARGEGHFENVGRTLRRGAELSAWSRRWRASYALVDATFEEHFSVASPHHPLAGDEGEIEVPPGSRIPATSRHVLKLGLTGPLPRGSVDLDVRWVSSQFIRGDEGNLAEPISSYWVAGIRGDHAISSRLLLFVSVENLLNTRYATFGLFGDPEDVLGEDFNDPRFVSPGAPRGVRAGARVTF